MLSFVKSLFGRTYHPLNTITLSKSALIENYRYLASLGAGMAIAPVLKSNAYGHGLVEIASIVDTLRAPFLCVDSIYEAYELHKKGIKTPILIMGYVHPESLRVKRLPFSFAVFTMEMLLAIKKYQPHAPVHIFVDTGMHREGVVLSQLPEFLQEAKKLGVQIEGCMSHLAMADVPSDVNTQKQVESFEKAVAMFHQHGIYPKWIHASASLALLQSARYQGRLGNVGRSGVALYGVDPLGKDTHLKPVLEFSSTLVQIKTVLTGEKIGYDFTYTAKKKMKIGILPVGYNDGVDRGLSNTGVVLIDDTYCAIVGRVSMNLTAIDLTTLPSVAVGQRVVVYSREGGKKNSLVQCARIAKTIPYELLIHLVPSTRRVVIG